MSAPGFVHLRLHSEYSIVDGMVRLDEAVAAAAADRMPALALTDLGNVFGMVKFYKAARSAGVKPIIGCDVWITHSSERDAPQRLLLLCQSREGLSSPLRLADARLPQQPASRTRSCAGNGSPKERAASSRCRDSAPATSARRSCRAMPPARNKLRGRGRAFSRIASISKCSAPAAATTKR